MLAIESFEQHHQHKGWGCCLEPIAIAIDSSFCYKTPRMRITSLSIVRKPWLLITSSVGGAKEQGRGVGVGVGLDSNDVCDSMIMMMVMHVIQYATCIVHCCTIHRWLIATSVGRGDRQTLICGLLFQLVLYDLILPLLKSNEPTVPRKA